ncbi:P-loop containing nucleoside triphosphate hydrolase protein [Roridomyces roridus]|uniref:P-loop containing nucleoside triphosphate hydrolase protein n=1 Tax=Roridomyces roridus TaxID=1738132 RepID=A0AAD7B4F4_9AGAR|nr:P-loop containing nucleoside triphosphate hydrolase protein [Roridomyces roridus]
MGSPKSLPETAAFAPHTSGLGSWFPSSLMGISSIFGALGLLSVGSSLGSSLKLLILGSLLELGRRLAQWLFQRFRFQYSITAQFTDGDPAYEWIVLFITQEHVWKRSREFAVTAKNSERKWSVNTQQLLEGNADYVPMYQIPQLFKWRGYWIDIKRTTNAPLANGSQAPANIYITIYTLDMKVLSAFVEEARERYVEVNRPHLVVHLMDPHRMRHRSPWVNVKHKLRRPLSSIILPAGVLDSLVQDAQEFLQSEDWYTSAGIPHRRGYLLHGPPGTGKTSTIYALAGVLNLEIFSLSLASNVVDDITLQQAASTVPKHGIFLIEDIDCAFPSREEQEEHALGASVPDPSGTQQRVGPPRLVTLSGLLNVIDGVGSEEGRLFFATTNYIDRLDPAFLRPGRVDRKIEYGLATSNQARALFVRFFPEERFPGVLSASDDEDATKAKATPEQRSLASLAEQFAQAIPDGEFSTADLQGYLLGFKTQPVEAVAGVKAWVEREREERRAREVREEERRVKRERGQGQGQVQEVNNG